MEKFECDIYSADEMAFLTCEEFIGILKLILAAKLITFSEY